MTNTKNKVKNEAKPRANAAHTSERIERRTYGTVLVRTPREGIKIEQLIAEKSDKKSNR